MLATDSRKQRRWQTCANLNVVQYEVITIICSCIVFYSEPKFSCSLWYDWQFKRIVSPVVGIGSTPVHSHRRYWSCSGRSKQLSNRAIVIGIESDSNIRIVTITIIRWCSFAIKLVICICNPERNKQVVNTITRQIYSILIENTRSI